MIANDPNKNRSTIISVVIVVLGLILCLKAMQLQIFDKKYKIKADAITLDKKVTYPSRGMMYDRNGKLLVYNLPMYEITVVYRNINPKMDTLKFCELLGIDTPTFKKNLEKDWTSVRYSKSIPYTFLNQITPEIFTKFQEHLFEFPGFEARVRNVRGYPQHNAAQIIGYINEVTPEQIDKYNGEYEGGDFIGVGGLERYYEKELKGRKGINFLLKDNIGRVVGPYRDGDLDTNAIAGKDLNLSIDLDLQTYGEYLLKNKIGSIVAIEPKTGEVLCMVTSPTYDPNILALSKERSKNFAKLNIDTLKPLFDRSVSAQYPPGSIFKPVLGLIAMQRGLWDQGNGVACHRGYTYGRQRVKCHHHYYAGNMATALQHSCNAYFITLYRKMVDVYGFRKARYGLDTLNSDLRKFGLGITMGIDFPFEKDGNAPSAKYYDKKYPEKNWYSTTFMTNGIGQGEMQMTTVQMANVAAIIANNGKYYLPHLVKSLKDNDSVRIDNKYTTLLDCGVEAQYFSSVKEGMRLAISNGSATNAYLSSITICGKTGTAENFQGDDSSVFSAFAPMENPQIAIAVYLENGGWGNDYAAPIASLMIQKYIQKTIPNSRKGLESKMSNAYLAYYPGRGYYVHK
jgi:penicillin-binding protein 2